MTLRPFLKPTPSPAGPKPRLAGRQDGPQASASGSSGHWNRLMEAAQAGNGGAYHRLLGEIAAWLERYFGRRLPPGDIDDAVQETLLAIHRRRHTFDPDQPFLAWLAAIARRKWIDHLRSSKRRATEEMVDSPVADHEAAVTSASVLTSLLGHLRPAQAHVIELVKLRGFSIEEASRETGQSISAVKVNIHRGLARLTAFIANNDDVE
jgi:RNA polymerase sigma factor (sigma-70 family)